MTWHQLIQTIMGCIGSVGFAVLFNIRGRKLILAGAGGAMTCAIYLVCLAEGLGAAASLFVASLAAAAVSEILARVVKAPVIMLLVPMLIPLFPGGDLYYMMNYLVRGSYETFGVFAQRVLSEAGAIALGIICVASLMNIIMSLRQRFLGTPGGPGGPYLPNYRGRR